MTAKKPSPVKNKKTSKRTLIIVALALIILGVCAGFVFQQYTTEQAKARDLATFNDLLPHLAQIIRAENPEPGHLLESEKLLAATPSPQSPLTEQLVFGGRAFLGEKLKEADAHFVAAARIKPESPDLYSFQAAANLKLGNTARAEELYIKALALKSAARYDPLRLSSDQLGLALCLFLLHRADEALPLAQQAWDIRHRELGPVASDTISAAGRLATIEVALGQAAEAESLLKQSYLDGLNAKEKNAAVLEEVRLFLEAIAKTGDAAAMAEFFATASPTDFSPKKPEPEPLPEPEPEKEPEPPTAETLAQWEDLARKMAGYNDSLAADLWVKIIIGRQALAGLDLYHPDLRPVHLELVRAYMAARRFNEAEEELRPILMAVTDRASPEFLELATLMAHLQEEAGRFKDAEAEWLSMAEPWDTQVAAEAKTKAGASPAAVETMLHLHLQIAENYLKQGKAAAEAELELRAALGRLNTRQLNTYPGTAEIYLRLARLLKTVEGRSRDRADYYRRAKRAAEAVLKRSPEAAVKTQMESVLAAVAEETKTGRNPQKPSEEPLANAAKPQETPPEPDMLRLELSALAVLERLAEFQPRIEAVLAEAAARDGEGSAAYMRYYSLKLKGLEEDGRIEELTAELLQQAAQPLGRNAPEQAWNKSSALIYAARANEKTGRNDTAVKLYQEALKALAGHDQEAIAARRRMLEETLAALNR